MPSTTSSSARPRMRRSFGGCTSVSIVRATAGLWRRAGSLGAFLAVHVTISKPFQVNPIGTVRGPYKVLLLRGAAEVRDVDGLVPEYVSSAHRYFGEEQGAAWVEMVGQLGLRMVSVSVTPQWARVLDFETRFPSALARAMAAAQ
jgi:hypothetical protein